jgi:hypothetical protein
MNMPIQLAEYRVDRCTDKELTEVLNEIVTGNRLQGKTARLWVAVLRAFDEAGPPMTVRQMYYALVARGTIPKTDEAYDRVCYHLLRMRRENIVPYAWIADNTRWMRKPSTYSSLEAYLNLSQQGYRRALWDSQPVYVEVWCEKDALAGVLYRVTEKWDVPLMVTRGYPSETFVYDAACTLKGQDKPVYLYYFGDHDPSGKDIPANTRQKLWDFGARFQFEQVAVLPWQIEAWDLPTRPTKRTDSRAKGWLGGSVELDAIPVAQLRSLVEKVITQHIDVVELDKMLKVEEAERATFDTVIENMGLARSS